MKLATTTGDFSAYTSDQAQSVKYIAASGFKYIDYSFGADYTRKSGIYTDSMQAHLDRMLATAAELGVKFVQSHSPMGAPIADGNDAFVDDTVRSIEAAGILGIPTIVVHSGYVKGISKDECFERNRDFYRRLIPTAEKYGIYVLIENFNKMSNPEIYWVDNAADLRDMLDYVDHPLIKACWDVGHGNMQETPQDEALRILGSRVKALHVQDNYGNADSHMAPFFGTVNLDSLMHGLSDIGYDGYFTFESGNFFLPAKSRRRFEGDTRLASAPLDLRLKAERLLYDIGECVLRSYDMFEE